MVIIQLSCFYYRTAIYNIQVHNIIKMTMFVQIMVVNNYCLFWLGTWYRTCLCVYSAHAYLRTDHILGNDRHVKIFTN